MATPFTVTNTNDMGEGSLRQAIINANQSSTAGPVLISFEINDDAGNPLPFAVIQVGSTTNDPLPPITHAVNIDGTTQPGYATGTFLPRSFRSTASPSVS